jgi:hypothetical protein
MADYLRYAGQALAYGLFVGIVGYFSSAPAYVHLDPELALIKLSFSHAGQTRGECRRRTDEELARLAPNMRTPYDCPRERSPITVALELDGKPLYAAELPPTGFTRDGASTVYQRFPVAAGTHRLRARLKDNSDGSRIGPPKAGPERGSARGEPQGQGGAATNAQRAFAPPSGRATEGAPRVSSEAGLWSDETGEHSVRVPDFNYVKEAEVTLAPAQVFVVDFDARRGGFVFKSFSPQSRKARKGKEKIK